MRGQDGSGWVSPVKEGLAAWAGNKGLGGTSVTGQDLGLGEVQSRSRRVPLTKGLKCRRFEGKGKLLRVNLFDVEGLKDNGEG